jgi:Tetratricopeptide repeat
MRRILRFALVPLLMGGAARAAPPINGEYDSPLGRVRVDGDGTSFRATVLAPSAPCRFTKGEQVMRATLLDDSLAGEVRVCQTGCAEAEAWAKGVLLVGPKGLSGAVHVAAGCQAPTGRNGGISFTRAPPPARAGLGKSSPKVPPAPAGTPGRSAVERARVAMRDGAAWLGEGNFEKARARFEEALALDPRLPEAYNGVGVTWRMRDDLTSALEWYKKALGVDPDFGDAYYNMACVYALSGQPELALRYLQIAAVNGYATAEGIGEDPDLASLRDLPAYQALVRARM